MVATGTGATGLGWRLGLALPLLSASPLLEGLLLSLSVAERAFDALRVHHLQHSGVVQPDPEHLRFGALGEVIPCRQVMESSSGEALRPGEGHERQPVLGCRLEPRAGAELPSQATVISHKSRS